MSKRMWISSLIVVAALVWTRLPASASAAQKGAEPEESAPDVPDAITVPSDLQPVLFAHGSGSRTYACEADAAGKYSWTLESTQAELKDRKGKVIGEHSAEPTWKLKDGSEVTGKEVAHVDSLDADSVPWSLLDAVSNSGKGALAKVTKIQRIHTRGGQPANEPCDESHKGTEIKSSYTADYYFYAPAKQ